MAEEKYIATLRLDTSKLYKDVDELGKILQKTGSTGGQAGKEMAAGFSSAEDGIRQVLSVTSKLAKDGSIVKIVRGYQD